jgi:hypothetical protein
MFRQQAYATLILAGSDFSPLKYGKSSSITDLTTPDASDADE